MVCSYKNVVSARPRPCSDKNEVVAIKLAILCLQTETCVMKRQSLAAASLASWQRHDTRRRASHEDLLALSPSSRQSRDSNSSRSAHVCCAWGPFDPHKVEFHERTTLKLFFFCVCFFKCPELRNKHQCGTFHYMSYFNDNGIQKTYFL